MLCGLTAGAWLGAAEAPTKLWAILAGCLWAVANTLTIFAVRDVGLSIAFPLWNSNSLLGIFWGIVFFQELRGADWRRWVGVLGGAALMFAGATALAIASATQAPSRDALRGVAAALSAGVLWGTMYIPYRKAYLTGMSPLSFITFFTVGELGMMTALAVTYSGGFAPLLSQLSGARHVLFWLLAGGFVWVVGDLFQQYAVKYAGITRGIPLSNTNQLWGLMWGILVFGELRGAPHSVFAQVIGGSIVMALGAVVIALSSVSRSEHLRWEVAAAREGSRYGVDPQYTRSRLAGKDVSVRRGRTWVDWSVVTIATATIIVFALAARAPQIALRAQWAATLVIVTLGMLGGAGFALWKTTRFN